MTPKQELFVREYTLDLNATQAAIRAGYSPDTAYSIGHENLNKPELRSAIDKALEERNQKIDYSAERILEELAKIAFDQGVKPNDRISALNLLGRHRALFVDRSEVKHQHADLTDEQLEREIALLEGGEASPAEEPED